ncbi:MAG: hypothetical protein ACRD0U_20115 [Acidimicrobiales bacterium]
MATNGAARSLESMLWDAANILRGPVDASDFATLLAPIAVAAETGLPLATTSTGIAELAAPHVVSVLIL